MKRIQFKERLFILLILSSIFSYIFHAILTIRTGQISLWTYSLESVNIGLLGKLMIFSKDFIAVVLFIFLFIKKGKENKKVLIYFFCLMCYGTIVLFISGNFDFRYILAGFRSYLFFIVSIMWCNYRKYSTNGINIDRKIRKVLIISLYVEFIIILCQIALTNSWSSFGSGGYRLSGTFGNSGGLGYYCIAMAMYITVASTKNKANLIETIVHVVIIIIMSIASGTRTAILCVALLFMAYIFTEIYRIIKLDKRTILFSFLTIIILFGKKIFEYTIARINRGNIMESGGSRVTILIDLILNSNFFNTIIGNGVGYGTNTAVNLKIPIALIYDGTINTIIAQFGIIGAYIFGVIVLKILFDVYIKSINTILIGLSIIFSIFIIFLAGNYFEQISMVIISVYSVHLLIRDERIYTEK